MSYRKHNIQAKIKRIKPKRNIISRLGFWYATFSIVILVALVYFLVFSHYFKLGQVVILENGKINRQELENFILDRAVFKIFNFSFIHINSKSLLLINKRQLSKEILDKFTAVEKVLIDKDLPNTLRVTIVERMPIGSFCSGEDCYLIDAFGILFEKSSNSQAGTIVRHSDQYIAPSLGEKVISQEAVLSIYKVQRLLEEKSNIFVKEALMFDSGRLNITTTEGWKIYLNLHEDIDHQLVKLDSLLSGGMSDESKANLYYIDLRPEDRAIVCDNNVCAGNL